VTVAKVEVEKEGIFEMLYPAPVILVTSVDGEGKPNIITLAWATPTSYDPPMVALAVRPERYSYGLIKGTGEFVVNVPTRGLLGAVMACGTTSGRTVDKFRQAGLTPSPARMVKPPTWSAGSSTRCPRAPTGCSSGWWWPPTPTRRPSPGCGTTSRPPSFSWPSRTGPTPSPPPGESCTRRQRNPQGAPTPGFRYSQLAPSPTRYLRAP